MINKFYKSFEDIHRGSRESIGKRLEVYLPFILPFKEIDEEVICIDLGCGRGEWLELVTNQGFKAKGIDIDDNMLLECKKLSLDVLSSDAISALNTFPDASVSIISAFHLIEHIEFEELFKLIETSMRVLKDGGILILETPNPENIIVSTVDFYIDPTHSKPIPPLLLEFLITYCGFHRHKLLRLYGSQALLENENHPLLIDVLGGVSPNYAVVAQKKAPSEMLELFSTPFSQEYGITLHQLASSYDAKYQSKLEALDSKIYHLNMRFDAIINSKSWKYTAWLRKLSKLLKG